MTAFEPAETTPAVNSTSIGQRHARWIGVGTLVSTIALVTVTAASLAMFGMPWLAQIGGAAIAVTVATVLVPPMIARHLAGRFVDTLTAARLSWVPTTPTSCSSESIEFFVNAGFIDYGAWMLVDAKTDEVLGGVGSRFFWHPELHVSGYVDETQYEFRSELSDGRKLVTTSVGAVPHPAQLVQGIKGGDLDSLLQAHLEGLRALNRSGIQAVEPADGPLGGRWSGDLLDQEHLASLDRRSAVRLLDALVDAELTLVSSGGDGSVDSPG